MSQSYHSNATTNINIRHQIQSNFSFSNEKLALRFGISKQTVSKWRNRDFTTDASSAPLNIAYALNEVETALVISIRTAAWLPLDEVFESVLAQNSSISRSSVYRCFLKNKINK